MIDLITPQSIIANLRAGSKKQALQELAKKAAELTGQHERAIFDVLLERERLGTTGVGNGIAIPHGKVAGLNQVCAVFARLDEAIEFDALDDLPVDIVMLLLAPTGAGADHLKALSRVARVLRNEAVVDDLRRLTSCQAIYGLLTARVASTYAA